VLDVTVLMLEMNDESPKYRELTEDDRAYAAPKIVVVALLGVDAKDVQ
jgi:hypothetical protein